MQYQQTQPFPKGFQMPGQRQPQEQGISPQQYAQYAQMQAMQENGGQVPLSPQQQQDMLKNMTDEQLLQMLANNPQLKSEFDKLVRQNSEKLGLNKSKPITNQEYIKESNIEKFLDKEGGLLIEPSPAYVFKTKDNKGGKFFINVVQHEAIDRPEEKELVDMNNESGVRIPMSFGQIREGNDKKGDLAKIIDIVVSPYVIDLAKKDQALKTFLKELIATYILQKYKVEVNPQMVELNMKYKGDSMEFQRVKGKKGPKIQTLNTENQDKQQQQEKQLIQEIKENKIHEELIPVPQWDLYVVYSKDSQELYDGNYNVDELKYFKFEIEMPLLMTGKFINLETNQEQFSLKVNKFYQLALKYPIKININKLEAFFNVKSRKFYIIAPPQKVEVNEDDVEPVEKEQIQNKNQQQQDIQSQSGVPTKKVDIQLNNDMLFDLV